MRYIKVIANNQEMFDGFAQIAKEVNPDFAIEKINDSVDKVCDSDIKDLLKYKIDSVKKSIFEPIFVAKSFLVVDKDGVRSKLLIDNLNICKNIIVDDFWNKYKTDIVVFGAFHYANEISFFQKEVELKDCQINKLDEFEKLIQALQDDLWKQFLNHIAQINSRELDEIDEVSKRWGQRAESWDQETAKNDFYTNHEDGYERFNELLEKFLPVAGRNILEFGCGTGQVSKIISKYDSVNLLAIDVSADMISVAKRKECQNTVFQVGEVSSLLADNKKFNLIVSRGVVVSHIPKTQVYDLFADITKLSQKGAYLIFDFIQNIDNGDYENKGNKNVFSLKQICGLLSQFGWILVAKNGTDKSRVLNVVFHKSTDDVAYFVTGNPNKVSELNTLLNKENSKLLVASDLDVDEIKSDSLEKILKRKLLDSYAVIKKPVICTDGGIFIDALNGFPGPNSKQAAIKLGPDKILKLLDNEDKRTAQRINLIGYYDGVSMKMKKAQVPCSISKIPVGEYPSYPMDKILIPISKNNKESKTYAQIPVEDRVQFTELPEFIDFLNSI